MIQVRTPFLPQVQGFHFINSFDLLPHTKLPKILGLDLDRLTIIGLCGGMCYAAIDYFLAHQDPPAQADVSQISPALLSYLQARQSDSAPLAVLIKLAGWVFKDDGRVGQMTALEIPRLRAMLDQNQPAVLLLVNTQGTENPTENHQVVATGYDFDDVSQELAVYLYDPNHPNDTPCLTLNLKNPAQGIHLEQNTGETRRGFFVQEYRSKTPPVG